MTPEVSAADLPAFSKDYGMENALWASDPANAQNISTKNIMQRFAFSPGGKSGRFSNVSDVKSAMSSPAGGTHRFQIDGLTDPKGPDLWWMVERQKPDSVKTLVAVAKQKSPLGADAVKILEVVTASFESREAALVAAPTTMQTYEDLETLLTEGQGLDLKDATKRYKDLKKDKTLKEEILARSIYQQCQELSSSPKSGAPEAAKANLATLAKKYPETKYGKLAAAGAK